MGLVMTKIKLTNAIDLQDVARGRLAPEAVRSVEIDALADTGAVELCIPEEIAELLGVPVTHRRSFTTADGRKVQAALVGPIEFEVIGRGTLAEAIVMPRGTRALLGALQMEQLDLVVVPRTGEVIGNPEHPEGPVTYLLRAS